MFRHQGKSRTLKHNIQIASFLSFVAGIVNVTGYLSIRQLTTNVTGHFALFINDVARLEIWRGLVYFLYLLSFLLGSFTSSFIIEVVSRQKRFNKFMLPTLLESSILIFVGICAGLSIITSPDLIACLLLFAMGVQNSFVTKISNAIVRTTHLTGLFTDLGIDLSHLLFPKTYPHKALLASNIKLRISIISFFFFGGLIGGFIYSKIGFGVLLLAAFILIAGLIYDNLRFQIILANRKFSKKRRVLKKTA
tara:strand:+ start:66646 stop:67395 length:750 start_codon:yes stop_codon:yes gene_type:complete